MRAAGCVLVLAGALAPQQAVEIWCALPEPLAGLAEPALRRAVPAAGVRCIAAAALRQELTGVAGERVLVGVPELLLLDLAQANLLARVPGLGKPLPPRGRDHQDRFALPWRLDYAVAVAGDRVRAEELRSWDDVAFAPQLEGRLGLCAPDQDPMPWLLAMAARLAKGFGQDDGLALWTRLDARTDGEYQMDYTAMQVALADGRLSAAVLPAALLRAPNALAAVTMLDGRKLVSLLGVAVSGGDLASASAAAAAARLLQLDDSALGFEPIAAADAAVVPPLAPGLAHAWLRRFAEHGRGRGRGAENLAAGLDLVFGVLFAAFLVYVYLRMRREEQP